MRKSKGKFIMVKPSPFKENSNDTDKDEDERTNQIQDVDTTWVDSVYTQEKVDNALRTSGHHTEGDLRGEVNTDPGAKNVGGGNLQLGPSEF